MAFLPQVVEHGNHGAEVLKHLVEVGETPLCPLLPVEPAGGQKVNLFQPLRFCSPQLIRDGVPVVEQLENLLHLGGHLQEKMCNYATY